MQRWMYLFAAVCVMCILSSSAQEKSLEDHFILEGTLDLYTAHVWRGFVANDRPVYQPAGVFGFDADEFGRVGARIWANIDMTDRNKRLKRAGFSEIDYTAFYGVDFEDFEFELGHTWYTCRRVIPRNNNSTREVHASIGYNNDIVKPFYNIYHDYDAVEGWYMNVGLNKDIPLTDQLSVGAESAMGWGSHKFMDYYFNSGSSGLADLDTALFASFALTDHIALGARVGWSILLDSDARSKDAYRASGSWQKSIVYGGIALNAAL